MAARAIWKGVIRFADVEVPVKLYSAAQDRGVHFRLLHSDDLVPVRQEMINPETEDVVPRERMKKGFEAESGLFVILEEEELDALEPKASRDIEITRFVDPARISHQWYERPYFLGPDGDESAYFALAEALGGTGKEGVARWVMRKKEYVGALRVRDGYLALVTLRSADEVVPSSALEAPGGRKPDDREIKMAQQLIEALTGPFEPELYRDEYRDRVVELVEAKAEGRSIPRKRAKPKKTEGSLSNALQASLKRARKEKAVA